MADPEPASLDCEREVLTALVVSTGCAYWGFTYLVPADFTLPEHAHRFLEAWAAWKEYGTGAAGADASANFKRACRLLRQLDQHRTTRRLAWRLVLSAHQDTPKEWVERALRLAERLKERLER